MSDESVEIAENGEIELGDQGDELDEQSLEGLSHAGLLESLLFASGDELSVDKFSEVTGLSIEEVQAALVELAERYQSEDSGMELVEVGERYQLRTRAAYASFVRVLKSGRPRRLSAAALETLAIVAYRQPIVKSDVEQIRGVDATPTLKTLLDRRLIRIVGHLATVGQPALYGTTDDFLSVFGLRALAELPSLQDLKELESDPGEIGEAVEEAPVEEQPELAAVENG